MGKQPFLLYALGIALLLTISFSIFLYFVLPRKYSSVSIVTPPGTAVTTENGTLTNLPQFTEITSLSQVFTPTNKPETSTDTAVTLLVTGDVLLARSVNYKMTQFNDFTWPFHKTADFLRAADISYINLETPLTTNCPVKNDGMLFCGNLRATEGLVFADIDVVNIANNHASNQNEEGVMETVSTLTKAGLVVSGEDAQNAGFITAKNTRFAFLGYNEVNDQPGVARAENEKITTEVATARTQADVVVVQFHWGNEYTYAPTDNQRRLARLAIDSGADIIIGNHPHWFQPIEFYKNKLIVYSHGNFIFDQMWSLSTRQGIVGKYTFQGNKLINVTFIPIQIENYGQPRILEPDIAQEILKTLQLESTKLSREKP